MSRALVVVFKKECFLVETDDVPDPFEEALEAARKNLKDPNDEWEYTTVSAFKDDFWDREVKFLSIASK